MRSARGLARDGSLVISPFIQLLSYKNTFEYLMYSRPYPRSCEPQDDNPEALKDFRV